MGCSASIDSAAAKYAVGEPPPTINVWDHYLARLPTELRDKAAMDTASARILPTLAAKEAALRDQQRALSQELSRHTWRVGLQKSSKKGFAAALGAVEAIGALLARPGEACAAADFARIAKRRERQRLVEATVAVAVSSEHVKRQSMLRRRLAALQFARDYVDKLATASVSEIRTLHDEAQHELATAEVVLDRLSPALAASAGAKHRLLRAEGVLRFAEMPEHATLFDDESRARLASEAELCGKRLRAAKHQATRVKEARGARNLARQMLAMIKAVGGAPPTKEKALAVKLMVDDQILEAEDELVILRARRGVSRHALAQRELHGAAATLRELRTRKAALAQTDRSDTCVHQAMLMGQLDESVAVVALYRGARQLKRRERRLLRAALGASDTLDELLGEPLADVACYIRSAQDAAREEVAALQTAIESDSDKAMEVRLARERWEVARGARAFARAVAKRQRLPPDDYVTLDFSVRKDVKKKAAFKKLKQVKRMEFVRLAPKVPPLRRRLVVLCAADLPKMDRFSGASDPFAVVYWNDEKVGQTPVLRKTLSPQWGLTVPLDIPRPEGGVVRVEVFDHDSVRAVTTLQASWLSRSAAPRASCDPFLGGSPSSRSSRWPERTRCLANADHVQAAACD